MLTETQYSSICTPDRKRRMRDFIIIQFDALLRIVKQDYEHN